MIFNEERKWLLLCLTFDIAVPLFPIRQVHVDVCAHLWDAAGQHSEDFVLVKSRFLQTAHDTLQFLHKTRPAVRN